MQLIRLMLPLALTVTLAGGGLIAQAEPGQTDARPGHHQHNDWKAKKAEMKQRFAQELGLSEEQKAKVDAIHKSFHEAHKAEFEALRAKHQELRALKKSGNATPEEIKAKKQAMKQEFESLRADRKEMMVQMKAVLTPEQVEKLEAMKAKHKQKWQERRQEKRQQRQETQ